MSEGTDVAAEETGEPSFAVACKSEGRRGMVAGACCAAELGPGGTEEEAGPGVEGEEEGRREEKRSEKPKRANDEPDLRLSEPSCGA